MKFMYPAVFTLEDDSYWVQFPDLPGCFSQGDTPSEAMQNAQEALELYLEPDNETEPYYPPQSDISALEQPQQGFVSYVVADVDISKANKTVRKNLTIPEWLNNKAVKQGVNFSQVLQEALVKQLCQ